jgi:alpha-L-fucosidase 2
MAANLQGIWAEGVQTPWNCDYHTNINVQMNYWLAEPGNLAECVDPLIDLVEAMRVPGSKTARIHYGAPGWVVHTIHNVWGFTSPGSRPLWGLSPLAGAWLCQHLFEHYAFSGDSNVLRRVYPTLKHAAEFCVDWVVEDPHRKVLVSGPATSPENTFITPEGDHCSVSMGPAMDQQILWEHLSNVALAAEILGDKDPLIERVREARDRLAGPEIGADGRLMEWSQPFAEAEPEHRHVSHLFAVHPGKQITPRASPDLAEAARRSLSARGDGGTGWSMAWKICFWARLGDGDRALALLDHLLKPVGFGGGQHRDDSAGVYKNLFCAHPPFQIDGNLGGPAGIAEMLLQSHEDVLDVLPALPSSWQSGSVKGLRARGGFVVDLSWELGVLRSAVVTATRPGPCWIHYRGATVAFDIGAGDSRDVGPLLRQATPRASCPI